jgi:hypothetical protein
MAIFKRSFRALGPGNTSQLLKQLYYVSSGKFILYIHKPGVAVAVAISLIDG